MKRKHFPEVTRPELPKIGQTRGNSPFVPFPGPPTNDRLFMNNLSGEGLFDERPMTQTSLGRFVLRPAKASSRCSPSPPARAHRTDILTSTTSLPARVAKLAEAQDYLVGCGETVVQSEEPLRHGACSITYLVDRYFLITRLGCTTVPCSFRVFSMADPISSSE